MSSKWYMGLLLAGAMIVGCDEKKEVKAPDPARAADTAKDAAKDAAKTATDAAKDATKSATDAAKSATDAATVKATDATAAVKEQGSKLLDQLKAAVDAKKLTDAEGLIKQLDAIKDKLPDDLKTKFETLKKGFEAVKAGAANLIPAAGGNK